MSEPHTYYVGLMSGTSMDAVDAALVSFAPTGLHLAATYSMPYPDSLRQRLIQLIENHGTPEDIGEADQWVGEIFAQCANQLIVTSDIPRERIIAIGNHGQTVRHHPDGPHPFSLQIGDPNVIAEHTGLTTVADFRRRDMAAGGQGAPLVPAFHQWLFQSPSEARAIVNIGGIANITLLPRTKEGAIYGFDTGPGNGLMDAWCQRQWQRPFDEDGKYARRGEIVTSLLRTLLADPYFKLSPPKSTGKEYFNLSWLERHAVNLSQLPAEDVQRTLLELTATSITQSIQANGDIEAVYVCGGGARNGLLMERLIEGLPTAHVQSTRDIGLAPEWVEASAFAWLAMRTLQHTTGNLPAVTGARGARILGAIYAGT